MLVYDLRDDCLHILLNDFTHFTTSLP